MHEARRGVRRWHGLIKYRMNDDAPLLGRCSVVLATGPRNRGHCRNRDCKDLFVDYQATNDGLTILSFDDRMLPGDLLDLEFAAAEVVPVSHSRVNVPKNEGQEAVFRVPPGPSPSDRSSDISAEGERGRVLRWVGSRTSMYGRSMPLRRENRVVCNCRAPALFCTLPARSGNHPSTFIALHVEVRSIVIRNQRTIHSRLGVRA